MAEPAVYEHPITVEAGDIDRMGHVNNVVYLRYAQDAAVAHWYASATAEHVEALVWVARRHEIDYLKPAFEGERLVARTWVGARRRDAGTVRRDRPPGRRPDDREGPHGLGRARRRDPPAPPRPPRPDRPLRGRPEIGGRVIASAAREERTNGDRPS